MVAKESYSAFKIKSVIPQTKVRTYDDDLEIKLTPDKKQFLLVNKVDLENYIAGVVGSEAGKGNSLEYYKLQAILCRTYLLTHVNHHILEGFQVCDDVHCQAYFNRASEENIVKAVFTTKGLVVVDNNLNLITAAFHSNCGGETCNSEDVWAMSTTYLKSVKDTYCQKQSQAHWERIVPLEDWNAYLQLKHKYPVVDSFNYSGNTSFTQSSGRAIYFKDKELKIPLKNIRADFKLKSTYFSIEQIGDSVKFRGRGYGHGVGLCQEGAMQMSRLKYSYEDILHFYYKDVHLVDVSALNYFKQE
jgi:stage II sporulation protein D